MQTFLPYSDFRESARSLDSKRLGKQRVETLQVMKALTVPGYGWQHHPVTAMWRGHRPSLMAYQDAVCDEWTARGFADTCREKTLEVLAQDPADLAAYRNGSSAPPDWLGRPEVHESHRSKLLQKDPEFYRDVFAGTPDDLAYVWPKVLGLS
ncbi:MSMEG_6728 family protein [Frondihabitans peucedani]|uniref:MSMEG_6728 family protein n=1 Tax=Frondihabitans peucedani TaxID=598626 RepID=A0ABP8DY63_9MICO